MDAKAKKFEKNVSIYIRFLYMFMYVFTVLGNRKEIPRLIFDTNFIDISRAVF